MTDKLQSSIWGMPPEESSLFEEYLCKSKNYLEYGCGGSTRLALSLGIPQITSVESDLEWFSKLKAEEPASLAIANGQLKLIHSNIGPVGPWGFPTNKSRVEYWPTYYWAPWKAKQDFDLIFVDGRFRIACMILGFLMANKGTILAIHDYSNREQYHILETIAKPIDRVNNLVVFLNDPFLERKEIMLMLNQFAFSPE